MNADKKDILNTGAGRYERLPRNRPEGFLKEFTPSIATFGSCSEMNG
jgi:hypothetical protein